MFVRLTRLLEYDNVRGKINSVRFERGCGNCVFSCRHGSKRVLREVKRCPPLKFRLFYIHHEIVHINGTPSCGIEHTIIAIYQMSLSQNFIYCVMPHALQTPNGS